MPKLALAVVTAIAVAAVALSGTVAAQSSQRFDDVAPDAYYYEAVNWAVANGITAGCGDGSSFCPDRPLTRAHLVTFLHRYHTAFGTTPEVMPDPADDDGPTGEEEPEDATEAGCRARATAVEELNDAVSATGRALDLAWRHSQSVGVEAVADAFDDFRIAWERLEPALVSFLSDCGPHLPAQERTELTELLAELRENWAETHEVCEDRAARGWPFNCG